MILVCVLASHPLFVFPPVRFCVSTQCVRRWYSLRLQLCARYRLLPCDCVSPFVFLHRAALFACCAMNCAFFRHASSSGCLIRLVWRRLNVWSELNLSVGTLLVLCVRFASVLAFAARAVSSIPLELERWYSRAKCICVCLWWLSLNVVCGGVFVDVCFGWLGLTLVCVCVCLSALSTMAFSTRMHTRVKYARVCVCLRCLGCIVVYVSVLNAMTSAVSSADTLKK